MPSLAATACPTLGSFSTGNHMKCADVCFALQRCGGNHNDSERALNHHRWAAMPDLFMLGYCSRTQSWL